MSKIVIADDHPIVREGLKKIIARLPGMEVTGEAGSAEELLDLLDRADCNLVLLDISMPGRGGIEALEQIRSVHDNIKVLILSMHSQHSYVRRAIKAGAHGFLVKDRAPEELITAITTISRGEHYISPEIARQMAFLDFEDKSKAPHEKLSNREYQVLCMLARSKTVSQIAGELSLSVRTVSTYRRRILDKMGMKDITELIRYALDHRLIQ